MRSLIIITYFNHVLLKPQLPSIYHSSQSQFLFLPLKIATIIVFMMIKRCFLYSFIIQVCILKLYSLILPTFFLSCKSFDLKVFFQFPLPLLKIISIYLFKNPVACWVAFP